MPIIRVNKTKDYTVISNYHLRDKTLSLKAKGLLSVMLSLPPNWDYSIDGLVAICVESQSAIRSALGELKTAGYLVVNKLYPNQTKSGQIEYTYDIYEQPVENQDVENQGIENLHLDNQYVENRRQLNTKELNTKEVITKELNTNNTPFGSERMNEAFNEWLSYIAEKKQSYKTTGRKQLIMKLNNEIRARGETAVVNGIRDSMANGWAGIYFREDKKAKETSPASYDIDRAEHKMNTTVPKLKKKGERYGI